MPNLVPYMFAHGIITMPTGIIPRRNGRCGYGRGKISWNNTRNI